MRRKIHGNANAIFEIDEWSVTVPSPNLTSIDREGATPVLGRASLSEKSSQGIINRPLHSTRSGKAPSPPALGRAWMPLLLQPVVMPGCPSCRRRQVIPGVVSRRSPMKSCAKGFKVHPCHSFIRRRGPPVLGRRTVQRRSSYEIFARGASRHKGAITSDPCPHADRIYWTGAKAPPFSSHFSLSSGDDGAFLGARTGPFKCPGERCNIAEEHTA